MSAGTTLAGSAASLVGDVRFGNHWLRVVTSVVGAELAVIGKMRSDDSGLARHFAGGQNTLLQRRVLGTGSTSASQF